MSFLGEEFLGLQALVLNEKTGGVFRAELGTFRL